MHCHPVTNFLSVAAQLSLALLAASPSPPADPALDPSKGTARGGITYTYVSSGGNFHETKVQHITGTWRMPNGYGSAVGCGDGRSKFKGTALTYGGMTGSLEYDSEFNDDQRADTSHLSEADLKELKKQVVRKLEHVSRGVSLSVKQNNASEVATPENKFAMLGCLYLDEKNKKFGVDPPMFSTLGGMVEPSGWDLRGFNQFGDPVAILRPPRAEPVGGSAVAFQGSYDPTSGHLSGSFLDPAMEAQDRPEHGQEGHTHHELKIEYHFSLLPPEEEVLVDGPRCSCKPGELLSYTARIGLTGGKFEKFEVTPEGPGAPPLEQLNQGGTDQAKLQLAGVAKVTGKAKVVGVYTTAQKKRLTSEPLEVSFCNVDEPKPTNASTPQTRAERDYMFTDDGVDVAFEGKAQLNGKDVADQIQWELTPNKGELFSFKKAGKKTTFTANRLPFGNDGFGEKKVRAKIANGACSCEAEHGLRFFFPAKGKTNPEGPDMPNWAYYWKQTTAGQGIPFEYSGAHVPAQGGCGPSLIGTGPNPVAAAQYDYCTGQMYVSEVLITTGCYGRGRGNTDADTGIDCFAVALRHEKQHQTELTGWWGPAMANYDGSLDYDKDLIPDRVEKTTPGCKFDDPMSCPGRPDPKVTDLEFDAYKVGWTWPRGSADKEDWAFPGKQWEK